MPDMRYLEGKEKFLGYCWDVYRDYFDSEDLFLQQFEAIDSDEEKNLFLKLASFYKFLVRDGKFITQHEGQDRYEEYLDQTFKFIALMAFVEALFGGQYVDFYQWIRSMKGQQSPFPIKDGKQLATLYADYKKDHGAAHKAELFFGSFDSRAQNFLASRITIAGNYRPVTALAKLLYNIRSEFVHKARLIVEFITGGMFSQRDKRLVHCSIAFADLALLFEDGLLTHFGFKPSKRRL